MNDFFIWWIVVATVIGFVAMGADKLFATRGKRRIPEAHLFLIAALGGPIGIWVGASVWRHKTQKTSFRVKALLATAVNLVWLWLVLR